MFRDGRGNQMSVGIHPRNWYQAKVPGYTSRGTKKNTSAPRNDKRKGTLAFREKVRGNRRNAMSATMKASKNPSAFKVPGSLRGW